MRLDIICGILILFLLISIGLNVKQSGEISELNINLKKSLKQNNKLNGNIKDLNTQNNDLNAEINAQNVEITTLNAEINDSNTIISNALKLSNNTLTYLTFTEKKCDAQIDDYLSISQCLENLITKIKEKPILKSGSFTNYYEPYFEGIVVLTNAGDIPLDSSKFKLYLDGEVQDDDGCKMKGEIPPGYVCKLNFYRLCRSGDIIEVKYSGQIVSVQTC